MLKIWFVLAAFSVAGLSTSASAAQHPDDRYFDSRAYATPAKVKVQKAARRQHGRRVVSRRGILPRDGITLTTVDEQLQPRRETIQYNPRINSSASFPEIVKATILGGRPAGCPARFCGCGASLEVFGRIIPMLNLAANWLRFPRAAPAPGMVAARRGHVFVLRQHVGGSTWIVHDSNSGGRRTRIHPRSIAGYAIVNPRGSG